MVKPNTIKRNCSRPGTRFDFSRSSTSNTTMYKIVPAARPKKIITLILLVNLSTSLLLLIWVADSFESCRNLPWRILITIWCWVDTSAASVITCPMPRVVCVAECGIFIPDNSLMAIPIAIPECV